MTENPTPSPWLPAWLFALIAAVLVLSPTQVTLRHLALWLADVRFGEVTGMSATAAGTRCEDSYAVFRPHELKDTRLWFGDRSFPVIDNGTTWIDVGAAVAEVEEAAGAKRHYLAGFSERHALVRAALAVPGINLTPADVALGLALMGAAAVLLARRRLPPVWLPQPTVWLLLGAAAWSAVPGLRLLDSSGASSTPAWGQSLKELFQYGEAFVVALLLFQLAFRYRSRRRVAVCLLLGMAAVTVFCGLAEYAWVLAAKSPRGLVDIGVVDGTFGFLFNPTRHHITGSESSRNVMAYFAMLMTPFAVGMMAAPWSRPVRALLLLGSAAGLLAILHLGLLACALAGCVAVALCWPHRGAGAAVLVVLGTTLLLGVLLISEHGLILMDSVAVHRYADRYGVLGLPATGADADLFPEWNSWQQKYIEMQAAANAVSVSPLFGHGLGRYQDCINAYYTDGRQPSLWVSKSPVNLMERDAQGRYWVQAVETGLLGLWALLGVLATWLWHATRHLRDTDPFDRAVAAGVTGSLVALLLSGVFGSFLVRGLQLVVMAVAALPLAMSRPPADEAPGYRSDQAAAGT